MARTNEGELAGLRGTAFAPDTLLRLPHMLRHFHSADADIVRRMVATESSGSASVYATRIHAKSKSLPNGLREAA